MLQKGLNWLKLVQTCKRELKLPNWGERVQIKQNGSIPKVQLSEKLKPPASYWWNSLGFSRTFSQKMYDFFLSKSPIVTVAMFFHQILEFLGLVKNGDPTTLLAGWVCELQYLYVHLSVCLCMFLLLGVSKRPVKRYTKHTWEILHTVDTVSLKACTNTKKK